MKNIFRLFTMAALAFSLGACTDEEPKYNPAEVPESLPVYFSYEDNNEIEVNENTTTIEIPIYRKDAGAALTVPVKAQVTPNQNGFTFPANVTFASGSKESTIVVGVDMTKVQARTDYAVTVSVGNGVVTPYYTDKISYRFNYNPWNPMVGANGETTAEFYDGLVAPLYGLDAVPYDVKIETNPVNDKIIRVVDPYGPVWPYYEDGMYDTSVHHYMYFNISKPNQVFLCDENGVALGTDKSNPWYKSGLTLDADGEIYLTGMGNYDLSMGRTPEGASYGTLSQGNITYGVDQWAVMFKDDPKGSIYYGNRNGDFRIILPGYEMYVDPSTVWTVIGKGKFTDGILYPLVFMEDDETQEDIPVYEVEVAQFGGDPNMYRIMNPYKKGICPYGLDYSGDKYIEIDATDPECLNIELQATGINLGAQTGSLYICNYAYMVIGGEDPATPADVIAAGLNDTFENGVFQSKPKSTIYAFVLNGQIAKVIQDPYVWKLVLPSAPASASANAKTASTAAFNGHGPLALSPVARKAQLLPAAELKNHTIFKDCKKSLH